MENLEELRYPIGQFQKPDIITAKHLQTWMQSIAELPILLREAIDGWMDDHLQTPYRPEGWTVHQLIHHIADSHMNAYIRFKLALTEEQPTIKPYKEALWADLADTQHTPVTVSLDLIEALHHRWTNLLKSMGDAEFARMYFHPESQKTFRMDVVLGVYAWHSKHHLEHILALKRRNQW